MLLSKYKNIPVSMFCSFVFVLMFVWFPRGA